MFHGNIMLIGNRQKESSYFISSPVIAVASGGYKTDFNLNNIIATLCLLFLRKKIRQQMLSKYRLLF